jgi:alpha-tubulin suppressor-like RCC1 family protein
MANIIPRPSLPLLLVLVACSNGDGLSPTDPASAPVLALGDRHVCLAEPSRTRCWGAGADGQLGIGVTPNDTTPVVLPDGAVFVALAAGQAHTCGIDASGGVFCWGSDRDGQLGLGGVAPESCGAFPCSTRPRPIAGNLRFLALAAGLRFTCGLATDRTVYCWGLNDVGQLGTVADRDSCGDGRCSRVPLAAAAGRSYVSITAGLSHVCALDPRGTAFCWGYKGLIVAGQHTNATFTPDAAPVAGVTFTGLSAGGYHTCGVTAGGSASCWGIDALGAGPAVLESATPVAVIGGIRFRAVYSARFTTCGLDGEGAAFCWGPNISGEIGTGPVGTLQRFDQPEPVSGGLRFRTLDPGNSTYCGITDQEATFCWGRGEFGELGSGHANVTTPVQVPE